MLKELRTVLPAADLTRARTFYHDMLDLDPAEIHEGTLVYRLGSGSAFDIYETSNAGTAKNTQMCWVTDDLDAEMTRLRAHGVMFEEFEIPGMKTLNGVATTEEGRTAWFRDSEGNFICITQNP
jgi:predicted enzyme related to lactoylglutathione lyase